MRLGMGMGQISIATVMQSEVSNQAACEASGSVWVPDPNPLLSGNQIAAGSHPGACVPKAAANAPGFDPASVFTHLSWGSSAAINPPQVNGPALASSAPLPAQVINGPVPDVVTPPAPAVFVPSIQCRQFDLGVDQNKALAIAGLFGLFALFGGFR